MLLRIPRLLGADHLNTLRASLSNAKALWVDGRVTAGFQGAPVKSNEQLDEASAMARELGDVIVAQLEKERALYQRSTTKPCISPDVQPLWHRDVLWHPC
jgi:predicted 2-oxoglutarate/Fe(II)-dependent dioxygenase YbiX